MKKIIGGSIAIILGLFCFSAFFEAFFNLMAIVISLMLLVAGCLTIYLKRESENCAGVTACHNTTCMADSPSSTVPLEIMSSTIELKHTEPTETEVKEVEVVEAKSVENEIEKTIPDTSPDDTPNLLGNTGSLIFHRSDCKFSKAKNCTSLFNDREEAIHQGYKPCGICKP